LRVTPVAEQVIGYLAPEREFIDVAYEAADPTLKEILSMDRTPYTA